MHRYIIITSRIESVESTPTHLVIHFEDPKQQSSISVPYMLVFPDRFTPSEHASPLLTSGIFGDKPLSPTGTVPEAEGKESSMPMPRMGDSPKTPIRGLFWAGNSGSFAGNVALSVAQGMNAGIVAGDELGAEDLERMTEEARQEL